MRRRAISWSAALRDLKADRIQRQDVREERLRTIAGLRRPPALALSAWRGHSGRRYVVMIYTLAQAVVDEQPGAVFLGVRRGEDGIAVLLGAGWRGSVAEAAALAAADGATELHLHRLCDTDAERDALIEDLIGADAL